MNKMEKKMEEIEKQHTYGVAVDIDDPFAWFEDGILVKKKDWQMLKKMAKKKEE